MTTKRMSTERPFFRLWCLKLNCVWVVSELQASKVIVWRGWCNSAHLGVGGAGVWDTINMPCFRSSHTTPCSRRYQKKRLCVNILFLFFSPGEEKKKESFWLFQSYTITAYTLQIVVWNERGRERWFSLALNQALPISTLATAPLIISLHASNNLQVLIPLSGFHKHKIKWHRDSLQQVTINHRAPFFEVPIRTVHHIGPCNSLHT